jgi:PAS domain S-box-containing protein
MYSFFFTGLIFAGIALAIISREPKTSDIFHYIVFGCLLIIILTDHRQYLQLSTIQETPVRKEILDTTPKIKPIETTKKEIIKTKQPYFQDIIRNTIKKISRMKSIFRFTKKIPINKRKPTKNVLKNINKTKEKETVKVSLSKIKPKLSNLKELDNIKLTKTEKNYKEIIEKTDKLISLERDIQKRKKFLDKEENKVSKYLHSKLEKEKSQKENAISQIPSKIKSNNYQEIFDNIHGYAAIIQKGVIKQIKNSFARFLGYEIYELIDERLTDFVTKESFYEIEKYYLSKLKGIQSPEYIITLLKKDKTEVKAKVNTKIINISGNSAEIALFKII